MSRNALIAWLGAVFVAGVVLANTFYVVDQRQQAIVLRFGKVAGGVVNAVGANDPGLKVKLPFVETVILLDKRNQSLDAGQEEVLASDQERLAVDGFIRYRITDPLQYYRALGDEQTAHDRMGQIVNASLRQVLGSATSTDIISGRREALMGQARDEVASEAAHAGLGVQIIDLRIKRVDLPDTIRAAVYRRMQTARQQEAAQARAVGEQQKREIMADADKQVAITLATAHAEAERTRGEGDAKRAILFASSFGRDPKFAAFYRSMQAYETALAQGDTTLVLSPDSDFFRYFKKGPGG